MAQQALIIYFSQFNHTTKLAKIMQDATGASALRIKVATNIYPRNREEINQIYRAQKYRRKWPQLTNDLPRLKSYDVLLVGGPVWNGDVAAPVISFLNQIQDFTGIVAPFSTADKDTGKYQANFKHWAGKLNVVTGYHITANHPADSRSLANWLRRL